MEAFMSWAEMTVLYPPAQAGEDQLSASMHAIISTIDHAVQKCEDLCSRMRRQTAILNELKFATLDAREATLNTLKENGLNRVSMYVSSHPSYVEWMHACVRASVRPRAGGRVGGWAGVRTSA